MNDHLLSNKTINFLLILLLMIGNTQSFNTTINVTISNNLSSFVSSLDTISLSADIQNNLNLDCIKKFYPIISSLPLSCQGRITTLFKENKVAGRCCTPSTFVQSVQICLKSEIDNFTNKMTSVSKSEKNSFSCYKNNEVFKAINNLEISSDEKKSDNDFIRKILVGYNELTHKQSKCLSGLNTLSLESLSRMCLSNSTLPRFFKKDGNGNFNSIIKRKSDDLKTFAACSEYLRTYSVMSSIFLDSYVDQVNYLLGVDQCNYYSDFFNFNIDQDQNDIFFPKSIIPAKQETAVSLLTSWNTCANSYSDFNTTEIRNLKANIEISRVSNPNGLSTSIGRNGEINFEIIKKTFYLNKYPSFHVHCVGFVCKAFCPNCNALYWDNTHVVLSSNIMNFDVSCCNGICVIFIKSLNPNASGSEIFLLNNDSSVRNVDKLLTEKLTNAQKCFDYKDSNETKRHNGTNSSIAMNSTVNNNNFNNTKLRNLIVDVKANPESYYLDFRLGTALNLNIQPYGNFTTTTLSNYLTNDLYASNSSFFLTCENSTCRYQCTNCETPNRTFPLLQNKNINATGMGQGSASKRSGGSRSGGSSSSGGSSKSGGSSMTGGSSSSGSTKSGGSSMTGGSSSSGSTNSGGSSLAGGSSSSSSTKSGGSSMTGGSSSSGSTNSGGSSLAGGSSSSGSTKSGGSSMTGSSSSNSNTGNYKPSSGTNLGKTGGSSSNSGYSQTTVSSNTKINYSASRLNYNQAPSSSSTSVRYSGFSSNNYGSSSTVNINIRTNNYNAVSYNTYSNNYNSNFRGAYVNSFNSRNTFSIRIISTSYYRPTTSYSIRYYTYRPTYYSYYGYNSYYSPSWGFYNNYYLPNYNFHYYRAPNPNPSNGGLPAQYDPAYWMPTFNVPFNIDTYVDRLNLNINSVKISVECCNIFCVTYVESFDDGYKSMVDSRQRVFIDFNLRNYIFLDTKALTPRDKKCMLNNLFSKNNNGTYTYSLVDQQKSLNVTQTCNIETPYKTFPLKDSCRNELSQYCGQNNYDGLIDRFFNSNFTVQCNMTLLCPNVTDTSTEDERLKCGSLLAANFMMKDYRVSYASMAYPCHNPINNTLNVYSFIQKSFLKKTYQSNNSTSSSNNSNSSQYVNESNLSPSEKSDINNTDSANNNAGNFTIVIDNNTNTQPNTNTDRDLLLITGQDQNNTANNTNSSNSVLYRISSFLILTYILLI